MWPKSYTVSIPPVINGNPRRIVRVVCSGRLGMYMIVSARYRVSPRHVRVITSDEWVGYGTHAVRRMVEGEVR